MPQNAPVLHLPVHLDHLFRLIAKIYLSTHLLFYIFTDLSVHQPACSFKFLPSSLICTLTCQLICWSMYLQTCPKMNLPLHLDALLRLTMKTYISNQLLVNMSMDAPVHHTYLFILMPSLLLTAKIYVYTHLLLCLSTDLPVRQPAYPVYLFSFQHITCDLPSTHLLVYAPTGVPENAFTCSSRCFSSG